MADTTISACLSYTVKEGKLAEFQELAKKRTAAFKGQSIQFCQGKDNTGVTRQTYKDAAQFIDDLQEVGAEIREQFSSLAVASGLDIYAPEDIVKESEGEVAEKLGFKARGLLLQGACYSLADQVGFQPRWFAAQKGCPTVGIPDTSTCSLTPFFEVLDLPKALASLDAFCTATQPETGMVYYGFVLCSTASPPVLVCREAYKNTDAVKEHLSHVDHLLKAAFEGGVLKLTRLELHGPNAEVEKLRPVLDPLGALYYTTD